MKMGFLQGEKTLWLINRSAALKRNDTALVSFSDSVWERISSIVAISVNAYAFCTLQFL